MWRHTGAVGPISKHNKRKVLKRLKISHAEAIKKIKGTLGVGQQTSQPQGEVSNQTVNQTAKDCIVVHKTAFFFLPF